MELVPILSTIILVGTIATFILAVAAYILYQIPERRSGREYAPEERRREEPHVLVEPARRSAIGPRREAPAESFHDREQRAGGGRIPEYSRRGTGRETGREIGPGSERNESLFWEYTDEGFVPVRTADEGASGTAPRGAPGHGEPDQRESRRPDSDRAAWT